MQSNNVLESFLWIYAAVFLLQAGLGSLADWTECLWRIQQTLRLQCRSGERGGRLPDCAVNKDTLNSIIDSGIIVTDPADGARLN